MKAIVYDAARSFSYRDVEDPRIDDDEVLIRIRACGVCGTDLHIHEGSFGPRFPLIPGHEFAGEIAAVGRGAGHWQIGDRVVANCTRACGECFYCRRGAPLHCEAFIAYGIQKDGGFAEYLRIPGREVFSVPGLTWREAIMVEPTACAVHGMDVLAVRPGSDVLIIGAGPTGQVLAQLLKRNGAARLTVAAPPGPKLELASRLSADRTVAINRDDAEAHRAALHEISANGYDYVVEATGAATMCTEAVRQARRGGTVLLYGVYPSAETFPIIPFDVFRNELTIKGSFAELRDFGRAISYLEGGNVIVTDIVTDEFELKDWDKALDHAHKRRGIKSLLIPPQ